MNWYVTRIVFRIISGDGKHTPQFDEHLRLISAKTEKEAYKKAIDLGKKEQHLFLNKAGEQVEWRFLGVIDINKLDGLKDGIELESKITEADSAEQYTNFVRLKNAHIETGLISLKEIA